MAYIVKYLSICFIVFPDKAAKIYRICSNWNNSSQINIGLDDFISSLLWRVACSGDGAAVRNSIQHNVTRVLYQGQATCCLNQDAATVLR